MDAPYPEQLLRTSMRHPWQAPGIRADRNQDGLWCIPLLTADYECMTSRFPKSCITDLEDIDGETGCRYIERKPVDAVNIFSVSPRHNCMWRGLFFIEAFTPPRFQDTLSAGTVSAGQDRLRVETEDNPRNNGTSIAVSRGFDFATFRRYKRGCGIEERYTGPLSVSYTEDGGSNPPPATIAYSSVGRASVSKTEGRGFKSLCAGQSKEARYASRSFCYDPRLHAGACYAPAFLRHAPAAGRRPVSSGEITPRSSVDRAPAF